MAGVAHSVGCMYFLFELVTSLIRHRYQVLFMSKSLAFLPSFWKHVSGCSRVLVQDDVNRSLLAVLTKAGAQQLPATEHTTANGLPVGSSGAINPLNLLSNYARRSFSQPVMKFGFSFTKGRRDPSRVLSKSLSHALVDILGAALAKRGPSSGEQLSLGDGRWVIGIL